MTSKNPSFHFDPGLEDKLKTLAAKRNMKDDTIGPVITWTTEAMLAHKDKLLKIPGMTLHCLVRAALLKYVLQQALILPLYVMVKSRFRVVIRQSLLCLGKVPNLTGCNQNDSVSWHAAIACTKFGVVKTSPQLIEPLIGLRLHREICYADARLAFGGKELQHIMMNKTKFKFQNSYSTGARLAFGGKELQNHTVPKVCGGITHIFLIAYSYKGACTHQKKVLAKACNLHFLLLAGARLAFGGKELQNHTVPKVYGAIEPTAVFVPLKEILKDQDTFKTVTTEVFGPLQVCPLHVLCLPFRFALQVSLCPWDVCARPLSLPFKIASAL